MNPRIVISESATFEESYAAYELRYIIAQLFNVIPPIVTDGEQAMEEDVCIGATNRSSQIPTGDNYNVYTRDGTVYLAAGSAYGYEAAIAKLKSYLQENGGFQKDLNLTGNGAAYKTCGTAAEGQVRFMTYNVYGWATNYAKNTTGRRQPLQISMIGTYQPDIIAFQEFSSDHITDGYRSETFLNELKALGYAEVGNGELRNVDGRNLTPLFYKTDVFTVLDSGYLLFSGANDNNTKSVTWAVLEHTNGKKLIAMSTHFMYNKDGVDHTDTRLSNVAKLTAVIAQIRNSKTEYADLHVIMGGDLNCSYNGGSAPLTALEATLTAAQSAASTAGCAINALGGHNSTYACYDTQYSVFVTCPSHTGVAGDAIDHIFYSGNLKITSFATLTDRFASYASDHSPKLVDFTFGT